MRGVSRSWAAAVVLIAVIVGSFWVEQGAAARGSTALSILVLGDSYSAGNGAGDYYGAKGCWRSRRNYAEDFARLVEADGQRATVTDGACSGATTSWFFNSEHGRPPELDAVNTGYDVILLTVGGDDIDFAGIVKNCLVQISRNGRKCDALLSAAENNLSDGTLQDRIRAVLNDIRRRANPRARIVLLGYPFIEGQENYGLPYDHGKSIDVPKRLRALENLGDQQQQRAIHWLNARYHTSDFVFVKTKALFAGHELYALSLNPNRWFIAPETDAGFAWKAWWYHPNPTGWYEEAQLLLSDPRVPKRPSSGSGPQLRSCGRAYPTGILISVRATLNVSCITARKVIRVVYGQCFGSRSCRVQGFHCTMKTEPNTDFSDTRCTNGPWEVIRARS
jgi:hypothetical protein